MIKNSVIVIPFNALLTDVCDYAEQTARLLAKENLVLGVALGNPISPYRQLGQFLRGQFLPKHWGIRVLRPVMIVPFQRFELIKRFNLFLNILILNLWLLMANRRKILWFFEPRYLSPFLKWLVVDFSLFDCVDYFTGYKEWQSEQIFCLKKATFVTVNSNILKNKYGSIREDLHQVPLGFSIHAMPKMSAFHRLNSPLKFGFIGAVGERLDFVFLRQLLRHRPKDNFIFIGPQTFTKSKTGERKRSLFSAMLKNKRVTWLSQLSREEAWKHAQQFDVGLIPYEAKSLFDRHSFPMKTMEYFYAGLPVLSSLIEELKNYPDLVFMPQLKGWQNLNIFLKTWSAKQKDHQRQIALKNTWKMKLIAIEDYLAGNIRRRNNQA